MADGAALASKLLAAIIALHLPVYLAKLICMTIPLINESEMIRLKLNLQQI